MVIPTYVKVLVVALGASALLAFSYVKGGQAVQAKWDRAVAQEAIRSKYSLIESGDRTYSRGLRLSEKQEEVRNVTDTLLRETETKIPSSTCVLSDDWRLLYNAAATGTIDKLPNFGGDDPAKGTP